MTAKTSREPWKQWVLDLTLLFHAALELIIKRKRSPEMVGALKQALQLFKENKLRSVSDESGEVQVVSAHIHTILSMEVEELPLPKRVRTWCAQQGMKYVGEFYYLKLFDTRRSTKSYKAVLAYLEASIGETSGFDPVASGWCPPYWSDPLIRQKLLQRPSEVARPSQAPDIRNTVLGSCYLGEAGYYGRGVKFLLRKSDLWEALILSPEWREEIRAIEAKAMQKSGD